MKENICNRKGCGKKGKFETHLGWFCSDKCRNEIANNFAKVLMGIDPRTNDFIKPNTPPAHS